jgi:photosystem II stability/assembly factor-like uncharacterized protein
MDWVHLARKAVVLMFAAAALAGANMCAQQYNTKLFSGMKYRLIGPFRGGRALAVTGLPQDSSTYYFGSVAGGVWKTTDGGVTWNPIFDKESIASIGAIAVAPSDPNVIYVGTGESCPRNDISYGDGVYKSTDEGKTWTNMGLKDTRHVAAIVVDPHDANVVLVAALGHVYGHNAERGVFRSADGGKTWTKVLYKDDKTGAADLALDPKNSRTVYAALWQVLRTPYSLEDGGPGSGIYKSVDGGLTWKHLTGHGLPSGILGRIGIAFSAADPDRIYAQIEAKDGGLYVSNDDGSSWQFVNGDHRFRQRAFYFTHIFADPQDANTIYELNTGTYRSTDGGKTFQPLNEPHGDCHDLWIDPSNPKRMIEGNDGGATITVDGGKTWSTEDNQPTAQFYHVTTDKRFFYYIYGAQQDNTTIAIASRTDHGAILSRDWYPVGGGESGYIAVDPRDPNIVYADGYEGVLTRYDKRTGQEQQISPWPEVTDGLGAFGLKYRFQWTAPVVLDPHSPNALYYGANVLFKTTDGGASWTIISPDLTRNDKSKQQISGGPITKDDTGTEYYDTIFSIAPSPVAEGQIWCGSDDGLAHLTRDGGKSWTNVTPKDMPEWGRIDLIDASPVDAATAYMAVDYHESDDQRPYLYKTHDYGQTWTKITNGIPDGAYVHAVRADPKRKGLLFAGTETGVYVSFDDGGEWQPLQLNLPHAPVYDLMVHNNDLVVATHGRAFWILDDVSALRQASGQIASTNVYLFKPELAYRLRSGEGHQHGAVGQNAPAGAIVYYYLKQAPPPNKTKPEVTLEILDSQRKTVRKFTNLGRPRDEETEGPPEEPRNNTPREALPAATGLNRFVWDLRCAGPHEIPHAGAVYSDWSPDRPLAVPGKYEIRLTAQGTTLTQPLQLRLDPRVKASVADLQKQFELAVKIRDEVSKASDTVNQILDLEAQLKGLQIRLAGDAGGEPVIALAKTVAAKADAVADALYNPDIKASEDSLNYPIRLRYQLAGLGDVVDSADAAPTAQSYTLYQTLSRRLDAQLDRWHEIESKDVHALNALAVKSRVGVVMIPPPKTGK